MTYFIYIQYRDKIIGSVTKNKERVTSLKAFARVNELKYHIYTK